MNMLDDIEFNVARLALEPGDFLVVRPSRPITSVMGAELRARLDRMLDLKGKVLVIEAGTELSVLTKSEARKLMQGPSA